MSEVESPKDPHGDGIRHTQEQAVSGLPAKTTGLRWPEFVEALANAYDTRFGEGELPAPVDSESDAD